MDEVVSLLFIHAHTLTHQHPVISEQPAPPPGPQPLYKKEQCTVIYTN